MREGIEAISDRVTVLTESAGPSARRDLRQFWRAAALFCGLSTLFLAWMIVLGAGYVREVLDYVVQLLAGLVAVALCVSAARRYKQRRTGWALLAASVFVNQCVNAVWSSYDILGAKPVGVSLAADVCSGLALPLALAAALTLTGALGTTSSYLRELLDSLFDRNRDVLHRLDTCAQSGVRTPIPRTGGRFIEPRLSRRRHSDRITRD